ncbi:MobC family plasmid mobilization relaxosome protein [Acetobacter orientalis]|uniref:plasmid mobilization protein n=1 Tax=Acetobacter orientalis TaxID=146474 RepID=UPI0020A016FA|nr:plasmid mobilization relaxosome protein MobC [Acetobacter orientalis]MCP1216882.1 MobC family plasmid mobilization relaxosome protein [Acetobacter orientalis]MCP1219771.1 MobC family plasmid mobilization relaxosome protein [Acetobacter orientalis]
MSVRQSPKTHGRCHDMRIRLSDAEHAALGRAARSSGVTCSSWLRSVMLAAIAARGGHDALVVALQEVAHQLSAIGNNLNQIAHVLNGGRSADVGQTLLAVDNATAHARSLLREIRV